ncbi:YciI family protein [Marinimicrobium locisalis]|uniref:YciI family protein n=1 Tax=Marinimicrobium locisalis TaxID=546022 RepID=UPI003221D3FA
MFVVLLKFSSNKSQASEFMQGHNSWLQRGFDDGVFILAGSLQPKQGGTVLAHNISREALEERLGQDPFVKEDVVAPEILEITPSKVSQELAFLMP